jgi:type IV secretory pathway VirB10-like protein
MAEQNSFLQENPPDEPELRRNAQDPKGVIQKNLKAMLYIGAVVVVVLALVLSSFQKAKTPGPNKQAAAQPVVQDNTASNVEALQQQVASDKARDKQDAAIAAAAGNGTPAQQVAGGSYSATGQPTPCQPGQYCPPPQGTNNNGQPPALTPVEQQEQQLAAKERERQFTSRFESNLAYNRAAMEDQQRGQMAQQQAMQPQQQNPDQQQDPYAEAFQTGAQSNLTPGRGVGAPPPAQAAALQNPAYKPGPEVNVDSAVGQPYVLYEGTTLDTVLMNRLDGDAPGPVKVLVSNPVYSHDHQHVLVPEGSIVLGQAKKIGAAGFGQQRRMAVAFHRMIMPDGYSVDLDQFHGLDQIGEEGLKDKVNNHYFEIFGTSIALGVISGAAQITQGGSAYGSSGSQSFTSGAAAGVAQSATTVLDRFIQIPPTITIREGHRVKVYFTQDMLLPSYTNHTIPQSF